MAANTPFVWASSLERAGIMSEWQLEEAKGLVVNRLVRAVDHIREQNTFTCSAIVGAKMRELTQHQVRITFSYVNRLVSVEKFLCSCEM